MTADAALPPIDARLRRRGIGAAIACITAVGLSLSLGMPLLAVTLEMRGVSGTLNGLNAATAGAASILVTLIVTRLAQSLGAGRLLAAATVAAAASFGLFYLFDSIWAWFGLRVVFHGAVTIAFVLSEFWINALAPDDRRGLVMGIYATVLAAGFALGPVLLGLTGFEGPLPFALGTVLFGLAVVPVMLARDAMPALEPGARAAPLRMLAVAPMATFAALAFGAIESGSFAFLLVYGLRLELAPPAAALLVTMFAAGNLACQIPLGLIADRIDRRLVLVGIGLVGSALTGLLMVAGGDFDRIIWLLFLFGGVAGGLYTVGLAHLGSRFRGAELAAANAAFVMMYSSGMLIGPASIGVALDVAGADGYVGMLAAFIGGYAAIAAWRLARARN